MTTTNKSSTCSVDGCERQSFAYGVCSMHYQRFVRSGIIVPIRRSPNDIVDCGDYMAVILRNRTGKEVARAKFDRNKLDVVKNIKWVFQNRGYARGWVEGKFTLMHRLISGFNGFTDHINRDRLDNRMCNLREVTPKENALNSKKSKINTSGYKGVNTSHGKYQARITINGSRKSLGHFKDAVSAAIAYDEAALRIYGEFAATNFSCKNPVLAPPTGTGQP